MFRSMLCLTVLSLVWATDTFGAETQIKSSPGFTVCWKGEGGRFVEARGEILPNTARLIIKAHNFRHDTKQGREAANSALEQAAPQIVNSWKKQYPDKRLTEAQRHDTSSADVLTRTIEYRVGGTPGATDGPNSKTASPTRLPQPTAESSREARGGAHGGLSVRGTSPHTSPHTPSSIPQGLRPAQSGGPSIPHFPNVGRTSDELQRKLDRIKGDIERTTSSEPVHEPRETERPPTPSHRAPTQPTTYPTASATTKPLPSPATRGAQPRSPLQTEMLLIDKPVSDLPGGNFVAFSPNGKILLTFGAGARLWEVGPWQSLDWGLKDGKKIEDIGATSAAFSPDRTKLATFAVGDPLVSMNPPVLRVWEVGDTSVTLASMVAVRELTGLKVGGIWPGIVWSANGETLVSGRPGTMSGGSRGPGGGLLFWGPNGLRGQYVDPAMEMQMHVSVSPDGKAAVMATYQPKVAKVVSVPDGKCLKTIPLGEDSSSYQLYSGFAPNGKLFAATFVEKGTSDSGWKDKTTVRVFDTSTWEQRGVVSETNIEGHCSNFRYAAFSPDSQLLVTAADCWPGSVVTIWDAQSGRMVRNISTKSSRIVLFFPDGKTMVTGGTASPKDALVHNINFWNVETGLLRARVTAGSTYTLALSPDQRFLVTGDMGKHAQVWDLTKNRTVPYVDEYAEAGER